MQATHLHPAEREHADRKHVKRKSPVHSGCQRQNQKQPVGRIQQRGLHRAEVRRATENVRIPKSEISFGQLAKTEIAPGQKL